MAVDPATNLPSAPTRSENLGHFGGVDECLRVWEREFLVEDVNLYADLARSPSPAGSVRASTRDRPARSARYREFLRPNGFDDELRAVMRVDGSAWAAVSLFRERGRPAFGGQETELVAGLSAPLGEAVRDHARPATRTPARAEGPGPGLMLFAPDGELLSINDDALAWLEELPTDLEEPGAFGVSLPIVVLSTLMCARATAAGRDGRPARVRMRSRASGRWLVCHASCLRDANGAIGDTALVIEPAEAAEIAPIMVQAYELSAREREITELISQGFRTTEIAGRLHLSVHTVRDYVKTIFEKIGVTSRGELVATLFAEHHAAIHLDPAAHDVVGRP
ncbi:MAG: LuxR family transcriptional regulator [Solirubrobacterales bacterium]|nr:LuxR family transcriptional regulator [Solirubrobacterales bacterium]